MSRKDYIALAEAIRQTRDRTSAYAGVYALSCATEGIADVLAKDNPRFDRKRFRALALRER